MSTSTSPDTHEPSARLAERAIRRIEPAGRRDYRIGIVAARFNAGIVDRMVEGALDELAVAGVPDRDVVLVRVPGAWELPLAVRTLSRSGRCDAVIAVGCVIRGETGHYEVIVQESARGLMDVSVSTGVPVANAVLACETEAQAQARAGGSAGNKGAEAARAALEMAELMGRLR